MQQDYNQQPQTQYGLPQQQQMYPPQQYQMGQPYPQGQPVTGYPVMQPGYGAPPPAYDNQNVMPPVMFNQPGNYQQNQMFMVQVQDNKQSSQLPRSANGVPHQARVNCPSCSKDVVTVVSDKAGGGTWVWCLILSCTIPILCCVPFCVSSCQDKVHTCPSCSSTVGIYEYKVC